jgi:hypothetical protein
MAGTVTVTTDRLKGGVVRYSLDWTSDGAGAVSGTSVDLVTGGLVAVTVTPGTGGVAPTNNYDVTLLCDVHGIDVLSGEGANLSGTVGAHLGIFMSNTPATAFARQWLHGGGYTLTVAAAGAAKQGRVSAYVAAGVVL